MADSHENRTAEGPRPALVPVKVFAVGGAGLKLQEQIAQCALPGASFLAVGTAAEIAGSAAAEKVELESKLLRGLGTGGDPERGRAAAEENFTRLKDACAGAAVVFIVAGLGGGAGTGISPVLARAAKEAGAVVLAWVTLPFDCEGNRRRQQAHLGLERLRAEADGVICLPNQEVFRLIDDQTSVVDTFRITNELLAAGLNGVWRLIAAQGLIEVRVADLCAMLVECQGANVFATATAAGPARSRDVVDQLLAHPLLDGGIALMESDAVLVSLAGGPGLAMAEVSRVMEAINGKCGRAQVLAGAAIDDSLGERLALTVIAARRGEASGHEAESEESSDSKTAPAAESLDTQLNLGAGVRKHSRFAPPPPVIPPEKLKQLMGKQTGRSRMGKGAARMRQGQLPLEIVSKGRFDKSEPTIHKGEDLDVPTYIRRGVALN